MTKYYTAKGFDATFDRIEPVRALSAPPCKHCEMSYSNVTYRGGVSVCEVCYAFGNKHIYVRKVRGEWAAPKLSEVERFLSSLNLDYKRFVKVQKVHVTRTRRLVTVKRTERGGRLAVVLRPVRGTDNEGYQSILNAIWGVYTTNEVANNTFIIQGKL